MWLIRHWKAGLGFLWFIPPVCKAAWETLGVAGNVDFVITHAQDLGWVGQVIAWLLNPPGWSIFPMIVVGLGLIWWDSKRHRPSTSPVAEDTSAHKDPVQQTIKPKPLADVILLPPERIYNFEWDPPYELAPHAKTQLQYGDDESMVHYIPVFFLKNVGSAVAKNVTVTWRRDPIDWLQIVSSPRVVRYRGHLNADYFTLANTKIVSGQAMSYSDRYDESETKRLHYLAPDINNNKGIETIISRGGFNGAMFYFISALPDAIVFDCAQVGFTVAIAWNEPSGRAEAQFRVSAIASSFIDPGPNHKVRVVNGETRKGPIVDGWIKFLVNQTQEAKLIEA